jgi:hypothetical protein
MATTGPDESETAETEVEDVDETYSVAPSAAPVEYFGTEFDVHGLVRRFNEGSIIVPSFDPHTELPDERAQGFQRGRVWRRPQMDRFIESLLLGFPVPGIFLVEQPGKKYLVLDGQQRLTTLASFFAGNFKLENVDDDLQGLTYGSLSPELQRSLDDTFIQAIIIRVPQSVEEYESVYQIFERLNSGGTNLQPHEIRVALYGGATVELVRRLNNDENWRAIYGKKSDRLKDQELILRVMALFFSSRDYAAPLKTFLTDFLGKHRDGSGIDASEFTRLFVETSRELVNAIGPRIFRIGTQVNAAILDSVYVGLMERINTGGPPTARSIQTRYERLLKDGDFLDAVTKATANEESVSTRLRLSRAAFRRR